MSDEAGCVIDEEDYPAACSGPWTGATEDDNKGTAEFEQGTTFTWEAIGDFGVELEIPGTGTSRSAAVYTTIRNGASGARFNLTQPSGDNFRVTARIVKRRDPEVEAPDPAETGPFTVWKLMHVEHRRMVGLEAHHVLPPTFRQDLNLHYKPAFVQLDFSQYSSGASPIDFKDDFGGVQGSPSPGDELAVLAWLAEPFRAEHPQPGEGGWIMLVEASRLNGRWDFFEESEPPELPWAQGTADRIPAWTVLLDSESGGWVATQLEGNVVTALGQHDLRILALEQATPLQHEFTFGIAQTWGNAVAAMFSYRSPTGGYRLSVGPGNLAAPAGWQPGDPLAPEDMVAAPHSLPCCDPVAIPFVIREGGLRGLTPLLRPVVLVFHRAFDNLYPSDTPGQRSPRLMECVTHELMHTFDLQHNCGNRAAVLTDPQTPTCVGHSVSWPLLEFDQGGKYLDSAYAAYGLDLCAEHLRAIRLSPGRGRLPMIKCQTKIVAVLVLVVMLSAVDALPQESPATSRTPKLEVSWADEYVERFPMIVGMRIAGTEMSKYGLGNAVDYSLAEATWGPSTYIVFFKGGDERELHIGREGCGFNDEFGCPLPRVAIPMGRTYDIWFDVAQLGGANASWPSESLGVFPWQKPFPRAGVWQVWAWGSGRRSDATTLLVRAATADELEVVRQLRAKGNGRSWFPTVVLSDEDVPAAGHLPMASRRVVSLIGVLRAARRSAEEGLAALEDVEHEWG